MCDGENYALCSLCDDLGLFVIPISVLADKSGVDYGFAIRALASTLPISFRMNACSSSKEMYRRTLFQAGLSFGWPFESSDPFIRM